MLVWWGWHTFCDCAMVVVILLNCPTSMANHYQLLQTSIAQSDQDYKFNEKLWSEKSVSRAFGRRIGAIFLSFKTYSLYTVTRAVGLYSLYHVRNVNEVSWGNDQACRAVEGVKRLVVVTWNAIDVCAKANANNTSRDKHRHRMTASLCKLTRFIVPFFIILKQCKSQSWWN